MRLAIIALALVAALGCKDEKPTGQRSQPDKQVQKPGQRPQLDRPDVKGPGVEPMTKLSAQIAYSRTEIRVDETTVAEIGADGVVDQKRLDALISALEKKVTGDEPVGLGFHPELAYLRIAHLVGRLKHAGFRSLVLLAGAGDAMIPLELREPGRRGGSVQPIVTVRDGHVILWSSTGVEGSRAKPKLDFVFVKDRNFGPLTDALAEIVQRRWQNGMRPPEDFTIVLDLDRNETADTLMHVAAAVRAHGKLELFPKVALLGGL